MLPKSDNVSCLCSRESFQPVSAIMQLAFDFVSWTSQVKYHHHNYQSLHPMSSKIFGLLPPLVLDDGGCLNAFLPMGSLPLNLTHLSLGEGSRDMFGTLGLAIISGRLPHY
jgi:hypothetical protein